MFNDDSRGSMVTDENSRQSLATNTSTALPPNFPTSEGFAPAYVMRKLAFQPSDIEPGNLSRRNSLRRHATPDFLLASPAERDFSQLPFPFSSMNSGCFSSPSPDLPNFHFGQGPWQRTESIESEGSNESSCMHSSSDYDGVEMEHQPKQSPQLSLMRRGSQDSVTGALRVTRPPPATPRIMHHSLPAPTSAVGSVKHGRPLEAMCVDPFERKKRRVGAGGDLSRFRADFTEVELVGKGSYSDVFKARHRLDGQVYAVKRLKRQCLGCEREAAALALVSAGADKAPALSMHVIRYFSSWLEESRLFIQTEFCPSTLPDLGTPLSEAILIRVLRDVGKGLWFLHEKLNLAHLDVKPANILLSVGGVFKIGDLGLASLVNSPPTQITSGDARYLPRELLLNNFRHLSKADVFSLGASVLECMLGQRLEAEGEDWHRLRDGQLPDIPTGQYSPGLVQLVGRMLVADPEERPDCAQIVELAQLETTTGDLSPATKSSPGKSIILSLRHTRQKLRKLFTVSN